MALSHHSLTWFDIYFDIMNLVGVDHECDWQTDRQTDRTPL